MLRCLYSTDSSDSYKNNRQACTLREGFHQHCIIPGRDRDLDLKLNDEPVKYIIEENKMRVKEKKSKNII